MEEELNVLKKMGSEKYLKLAANGGLTDLIEENISRQFQTEDPLGFFQK